MFSGVCNIAVTKSDYAERKAHYKSDFSESWALRLRVTIGMPRLSYSVHAKIIFAGGAFLRRRFAWAMRRRAVRRKRSKIGRASSRERVCQYVYISVVAGTFKNKTTYE